MAPQNAVAGSGEVAPSSRSPYRRRSIHAVGGRCPLGCPYCSNPLARDGREDELDTATWLRVFREAAAVGVLQVHSSGGERRSSSAFSERFRLSVLHDTLT
jgi:MoaA/NifB/PqqE/SkfB family radical SAM enzyme